MTANSEHAPWLCHVCDYKSQGEQSVACSVCFKTTCSAHLRQTTTYNAASGLYEIQPICVLCSVPELCG